MEKDNQMTDTKSFRHATAPVTLANGAIIYPEAFDKMIHKNCHYIQHVLVLGDGRPYPLALIFPVAAFFSDPDYAITPLEGCFCPRNTDELGRCLTGCMRMTNNELFRNTDQVQKGIVILDESLFEDGKLIRTDTEIEYKYSALIDEVYNGYHPHTPGLYYIDSQLNGSFL